MAIDTSQQSALCEPRAISGDRGSKEHDSPLPGRPDPRPDPSRVTFGEWPIVFSCEGDAVLGMVHASVSPAADMPNLRAEPRGLILVVGGPQYRIGANRQYLLLAREAAGAGWPTFRFDYRGMGDADGTLHTFEDIAADLRAAIDCFISQTGVREVVLWGLCDGASAIAFYAATDQRVVAIGLANPWVRTEALQAEAALSGHYRRQLAQAETWRRILRGKVNLAASVFNISAGIGSLIRARISGMMQGLRTLLPLSRQPSTSVEDISATGPSPLPDRVWSSLCRFRGPVLLFLSGEDDTAMEFETAAKRHHRFAQFLTSSQVALSRLPTADHAFSRKVWRDMVIEQTISWLTQLDTAVNDTTSQPNNAPGG